MDRIYSTRRQCISGMAATGLTACLHGAHAQESHSVTNRIDIHHHFLAPNLTQRIERVPQTRPILDWAPAKSIEAIDKAGIATAILSGMTGYDANPPERQEAAFRARTNNDFGAKLVTDYKGRFGLFATLPLPYVDDCLNEIEYALDTLKADGVFIWTNYGNRWLGDPAFARVFEELNRRKAIVLTHPIDAPCCLNLQPDTTPQTVEWNTQTSRAIWSILNTGLGTDLAHPSAATRYPDITFIWPHSGGSLLGLVGRFVVADLTAEAEGRTVERNSRLYHLRRFYYDIAASFNRIQMPALKALVGSSQILLGSDAPFGNPQAVVRGLVTSGFSTSEIRAIQRDNALKILPRWR